MAITSFVDLADFTSHQVAGLLQRSLADKIAFQGGRLTATLENKALAMVFEKPSLRTRVSFETAMTQLGGHALYLAPADIGLGTREPVKDIARVLGRMCQGIMARTFHHETVRALAEYSPSPVINALSDYSHPCQAMADAMTIVEHFGELAGRTLAFVGDGNNVARSLAMLAAKTDMTFVLACPAGYALEDEFEAKVRAAAPNAAYRITHDPDEAVADADVIYADTWTSMGQEDEKAQRQAAFGPFQINDALLAKAPAHAIVLHCLPAYRGSEITGEVMERFADIIFTEAENRLHFQRSLLDVLLAEGGVK